MRPLKRIIDLNALRHNWQVLKEKTAHGKMIAVVKADAYGHQAVAVAKALPAQMFAVASIEEANHLRSHGITHPIMLLEGVFCAEELAVCARAHYLPVIHNARQLAWLEALDMPIQAWVKVDSGMHRLGFSPEEFRLLLDKMCGLAQVRWQGVVSHFACADSADLTHAHTQESVLDALPLPSDWQRCYANSAAIFSLSQSHGDWVRPGILLYGISPFAGKTGKDLALKAVMHYQTEVIAVHALKKGESAGYNQGFIAPSDGYLATIALGYGDGFPRAIPSGEVPVLINGKRYPLVGRIAMDLSLVWLGDDCVAVGACVEIFGNNLAVEEVAAKAQTIPYTLTTMILPRVPYEVIDG